jgi:6-phosphogluconolactonase
MNNMHPYDKLIFLFICLLVSGITEVWAQQINFLVGSTNKEAIESVAVCRLNEQSKTIELVGKLKAGTRPGYIAMNDNYLYAVSILEQADQQHTLRSFKLLPSEKRLEPLNNVSSLGLNPCHIAITRDGSSILTANYSSGSIAQYAIDPNGSIGGNLYFEQFSGGSVHPSRQQAPHAHYINSTIDNQYVLTADLGTDKVMIHRMDQGKMRANAEQPFLELPAGSGPRHLEFHPNNQWIYVLNELNSTISLIEYQNQTFTLKRTISTLPPELKETSYAAAVRIHPSGKIIYSSNRGSDSISAYAIDDSGQLSRIQTFGEGLGWVRDFNVSPSGKFIVAGNEKTDAIVLLELNEDGTIGNFLSSLEFPNPSCLIFDSFSD